MFKNIKLLIPWLSGYFGSMPNTSFNCKASSIPNPLIKELITHKVY